MESYDVISDIIDELREKGIKIALDDFGKGYSSLSYLRNLPIATLKIDKSFTDGISSDYKTRVLFSAILGIGRSIGVNVIVEGVETREQVDYLSSAGCRYIQGFIFGKPGPGDAAEGLLNAPEVK